MKKPRLTSLRVLALVATLFPVANAYAGSTPQHERLAAVLAADAAVTTEIVATVQRPDGSPVEGALVFTSAGGRGITDSTGAARFGVELPHGAGEVHVSAASTEDGVSALGNARVDVPEHGGVIEVGTIIVNSGAECVPQWLPTFGDELRGTGAVSAFTVFDDGTGPALYAGGVFDIAGGVAADSIAKWDGASWSPLGSGLAGTVSALAVFDDGSGGGPALYAGGTFSNAGGVAANNIAKWDGATWSPLGSGVSFPGVFALTVFDDGAGAGPALYAGGFFDIAGGGGANNIARWDGAAWSALSSGVNDGVLALTVFDDGSGNGAALYAGGDFTSAGGAPADRIAKWDGVAWSPLASGVNDTVLALTVFDDGSGGGPALYAGGLFFDAGGVQVESIAKWDGASWARLGTGIFGSVSALTVFDDGAGGGPALYAGGGFDFAGGAPANSIAKWDGAAWSPLGSGVNAVVYALTAFDDGSGVGPALLAGGEFTFAGDAPARHIASWNGTSWSPLGSGAVSIGLVEVLTLFDDGAGDGPALYAGGRFTNAGGVVANNIAKWNGAAWSPLGSGVVGFGGDIRALTVFDDGSGGGPALYAGGRFTRAGGVTVNNIARWDGASWSPLGTGMNTIVSALSVFDDGSGGGPALYAGGEFTTAGGVAANRIARWDGAVWSPLGSGVNSRVDALTVFDDGSGSGPALYAGGLFTNAGGAPAGGIAKWSGVSWSPLVDGVSGGFLARVTALAVFDDGSGSGPALYAGGGYTNAGAVAANNIAKWDGAAWSPLGTGMNASVGALSVFDDGSGDGPALYAGGSFTIAGGVATNYIAKWDGHEWAPLGSGLQGVLFPRVETLSVFDDGSGGGPALYAGGFFASAGGLPELSIARWQGCASDTPCTGDTNGDNIVNFTDLNAVLADFGQTGMDLPGDTNGDGVVNFTDLNEVLAAFGTSCD